MQFYCQQAPHRACYLKTLRYLSKSYENEEIQHVITSSEVNKDTFWKLLKQSKFGPKTKASAIRDKDKNVVHDIDKILEVWRLHFSSLSQPRTDANFDDNHYRNVIERVNFWNNENDIDEFTREFYSKKEVKKAVEKLNAGKAPGHDEIMKEQILACGDILIDILVLCFK